ncbi:MAG: sulfite exporter TauE/SafE family protein [Halothiobacillaceae bacterium]|nr:MAG: sulfite exporter TauE/SafE family protein [Halothiobacillaceae bacterium]
MDLVALGIYALLGVFTGLMAGLLGIGGGLIVVPALAWLFTAQGTVDHAHLMQVAVGTSLATILLTSIGSVWSHHRQGSVDWGILKRILAGLVIGSIAGSYLAHYLPSDVLKKLFGVIEILIALQMTFGRQPAPHRQLPGLPGMTVTGSGIGVLSSIMGMGGGAVSTPFFVWCNVPIRKAIATSAAIGLPAAIAGSAAYVLTGWNTAGLPPMSLGYVYLPAWLGIGLMSILFAKVGAQLTHRLPVPVLKKIFSILLIVLGARMLLS